MKASCRATKRHDMSEPVQTVTKSTIIDTDVTGELEDGEIMQGIAFNVPNDQDTSTKAESQFIYKHDDIEVVSQFSQSNERIHGPPASSERTKQMALQAAYEGVQQKHTRNRSENLSRQIEDVESTLALCVTN